MQKVNAFKAKGLAMLLVMAMVFTLAPTVNVFADDDHYEYDPSKKVTVNGTDFYYVTVDQADVGQSGLEIDFGTDFGTPTDNHVMATQAGNSNIYFANPDAATPDPFYYGCSDIEYPDYWKNEGLSAPSTENFTAVSPKTDSEGFNDMGGFDTVTRSTTKHGTYRGSFQFITDIYGYTDGDTSTMQKFAGEHDPDINETDRVPAPKAREITSVPADQVASCQDGAKSFVVNGVTYTYSHYVIRGIQRVPVKIAGVTYVGNFILQTEGEAAIDHFEDFRLGGQDGSNRVVDSSTGNMKELQANGEYGPVSAGTQTMADTNNKKKVVMATGNEVSINYNHKFGEYAEAQVNLMNADGTSFSTSDLLHYVTKFTSATYVYYGEDDTFEAPIATYGSMGTTDTWWSTNHGARIDAGFMFDSYRMGSPDGQTKNRQFGNWKVIFRSAGYEDLIATFYLEPEISYDQTSVTMTSQIQDFSANNPSNKTVVYESSDESVVKIDSSGQATAVAPGSAVISATVNKGSSGDLEETATTMAIVSDFTSMSETDVTLYDITGYKTKQLQATVIAGNNMSATPTWSSDDTSIATVDQNGLVTAGTAKGTTYIKAEANGFTATAKVTYLDAGITLDQTSTTLYKNITNNSTVTLNATVNLPTKSGITWSSSSDSIATVDQTGKVTAVSDGDATITVKGHGYDAQATVTVKDATATLNKTDVTLYDADGYNQTILSATFVGPSGGRASWTSSDSDIVSVNNGTLTANKAGTAVITYSNNNITATANVTVKDVSVKLDKSSATIYTSVGTKTVQLNATVEGPESDVAWTSSNKNVATVDKNGLVTAKAAGTAQVKATANGQSATATITVVNDAVVTDNKATVTKAAPKSFKAKAQKKKTKLTWKKSSDVTKYQIAYKQKGKKKWSYKTISAKKTSLIVKKLKSKKRYQFKVRSYKTVSGKKVYSKWSKTKTVKVK